MAVLSGHASPAAPLVARDRGSIMTRTFTMIANTQPRLEGFFKRIVAWRWWIAAFYALLLPPSVYFALKVQQDNSLDRLIVQSDADYGAAKEFESVFGAGEYILLMAEAPDPFAPEVLARVAQIEQRLEAIPGVEPSSALSIFSRAKGGITPTPRGEPVSARARAEAEAFRRFATGTDLFTKQGLVGNDFLAIPVVLRSEHASDESGKTARPDDRGVEPQAADTTDLEREPEARTIASLLRAVDGALDDVVRSPSPLRALRKIGGPYVDRYLDEDTARATLRYMPMFAILILVLNLALYRSLRTLLAFVLTLGVSVALTMGYVGATGGVISIVSPLVPMTILITSTATLVYIHSRYVQLPAGRTDEDHQVFALANKFVACTASIFATAVGFAALAVSQIRPIREMGLWVAVGLLFTWIVVFTLFPSLQRILRTPTREERPGAAGRFDRFADHLPAVTYRYRWALVSSTLVLCALGAVALMGFPGILPPMRLETDSLEYVNRSSRIYQDTKKLEGVIKGLSVTEVWLKGDVAALVEPAVLSGLDRFQQSLEQVEGVGAVAGPTTILRMLRYVGGRGDRLPEDSAELNRIGVDLERLVLSEPAVRGFFDPALSQTHIAVISGADDHASYARLEGRIRERWEEARKRDPALGRFEMRVTGEGPLQAKISYHLVPTLLESFALTVAIIFGAFLVVFRSGPARLMAMIPSLFAILVMFAVMRVTGMALNVATILIASTVLGTSENDQIHFFYHFLEKRRSGSAEEGLRHTLSVAGRAIVFATLINAGGFLAFAFADLPPMRQFGILSALAFTLSMIADFTALPAALWIVYREKPASARAKEHR